MMFSLSRNHEAKQPGTGTVETVTQVLPFLSLNFCFSQVSIRAKNCLAYHTKGGWL